MNTPSKDVPRAEGRLQRRAHAASAWAARLAGAAVFLIGCQGSGTAPSTTDRPYAGPPIELVPTRSGWGVRVTPPGGGWSLRVDRVLDRFKESEVFVTIAEPYPGLGYSQSPVTQEGSTGIPTTRAATLLVRVEARDTAYSVVEHREPLASEPAPHSP